MLTLESTVTRDSHHPSYQIRRRCACRDARRLSLSLSLASACRPHKEKKRRVPIPISGLTCRRRHLRQSSALPVRSPLPAHAPPLRARSILSLAARCAWRPCPVSEESIAVCLVCARRQPDCFSRRLRDCAARIPSIGRSVSTPTPRLWPSLAPRPQTWKPALGCHRAPACRLGSPLDTLGPSSLDHTFRSSAPRLVSLRPPSSPEHQLRETFLAAMSSSLALKREEADIQAAEAILSIAPHHSSHNSTSSQNPPPRPPPQPSTHASPTASHRSFEDVDSRRDGPPPRQSLPSLSEALARPPDMAPFERERSPPRPYLRRSASPRSSRYPRYPDEYPPAAHREYREVSPRSHHAPRPASFAPINSLPPTSPRLPAYAQRTMPPPPQPQHGHSGSSSTSYAPQAQAGSPQWAPHQARQPPVQQSPSFAAQPFYAQAQQGEEHRSSATQPTQYVTSYPSLATSARTGPNEAPWPSKGGSRYSDGRKDSPEYADFVKRHLDGFDMESSLNEVYESSHNLMQFSQTYKRRVPGSDSVLSLSSAEPTTNTVHEAIKFNQRIQDALTTILHRLEAQEAERAERSAKEAMERQQSSSQNLPPESPLPQTTAGERRVSGPTPKTSRRGVSANSAVSTSVTRLTHCPQRAAAPGRCHSCNRAETPEWRRGPDGARTLCNACGLRQLLPFVISCQTYH